MSFKKHLFIPDTQIRPGVPMDHLEAVGNFILEKQPDVVVQAGDWADMHSLSSYDQGTRAGEGARYEADISAANEGLARLMDPIRKYNSRRRTYKAKQYQPRFVVTLGNHENRIARHINSYPVLEGRLSADDIHFRRYGWDVYPFLEVVHLDGIQYSHYFPRNAQGRVVQTHRGAPSASIQARREMCSSTSGHLQGLDYAIIQTGARLVHGLIAGSFYMHEEDYLSPQGTAYWRGVVLKNEVEDGHYDPCFISLNYLLREYL